MTARGQLHKMAEEEEAPAVEPGPTLLTTELVAANLSILEEVQSALTDGTWVEKETGSAPDTGHPDGCGFAYTKCELGTSQCEVEAAADAFESYKQLRYLSLAACKLASCQPIAPLSKLLSLDLSAAALAEPGSLPALPSLQLLKLGGCGVASFAGCAWDYPALGTLDLSGNALTELPDFGALPSLTHLSVAGNQLVALPAAVWLQLPSLATLNAEGNAPLADVAGLASCASLVTLSLQACPELATPALLKPLAAGGLRVLTLAETPLAEQNVEVLLALPNLESLNGAPPSEEDRQAALELAVQRKEEEAAAAAAAEEEAAAAAEAEAAAAAEAAEAEAAAAAAEAAPEE